MPWIGTPSPLVVKHLPRRTAGDGGLAKTSTPTKNVTRRTEGDPEPATLKLALSLDDPAANLRRPQTPRKGRAHGTDG